jgi:hypothetical protein
MIRVLKTCFMAGFSNFRKISYNYKHGTPLEIQIGKDLKRGK